MKKKLTINTKPHISGFTLIAISLVLAMTNPNPVLAAGGSIRTDPSTGSYAVNRSFNIDIVVDGGGQAFNAAKATITPSSSLRINGLTLGNCDFSFVTTPTVSNPSFAGAILGSSSQKCTLYTLRVSAQSTGTAGIDITDAQIKKYGNAEEILTSLQKGSYTITSPGVLDTILPNNENASNQSDNISSTQTAPINAYQPGSSPASYTLRVNASSGDNRPLPGSTVKVYQSDSTDAVAYKEAVTGTDGTAAITDLPEGSYSVQVEKNGKTISRDIVTLAGQDPVMALGIKEQKQPIDWIIIPLVGIPALLISIFLFNRYGLTARISKYLTTHLKKNKK